MSLVTSEDERRIYEKYGDMIQEIKEAPEALTEEECMARLPEDAPISTGIFSRGFYYTGRGIKYRSSFWAGWCVFGANGCLFVIVDVLMKLVFFPVAILCFRDGQYWGGLIALGLSRVPENLAYVFSCSLCPYAEIDLANKYVRVGRWFVTKIPFKDIGSLFIREQTEILPCHPKGTRIYLISPKVWIEICMLHVWEDQYTDVVKRALLSILGKQLEEKYFLNGKEIAGL